MNRAGLLAPLIVAFGASTSSAADPRHPTVIELFTAQGCAACPPAQSAINALADRPDLLPLSFAVTYWDAMGWKDRFAQKAFTERQRSYARIGHRQAATPQVILNGRFAVTGNDRAALNRAIVTADRGRTGPPITYVGNKVRIGAASTGAREAIVWLVRYDPRTIDVAIAAGENAGRTLPHRNVVRSLNRLGAWDGTLHFYSFIAPRHPRWRSAIIVQQSDTGSIIGAYKID